jgi:hypothetical protein
VGGEHVDIGPPDVDLGRVHGDVVALHVDDAIVHVDMESRGGRSRVTGASSKKARPLSIYK